MQTIDDSAENFKKSPLGFLMSVMAKYQAYMQKNYENSNDAEALKKSQNAGDMLDNLKIELSKTESLRKEPSNEAVLMHVIEHCEQDEKEIILDSIYEYLAVLDNAIQNIDKETQDGKDLINEYYDVSRLGLILNCYLGGFDNDDFFYGTLAEIAETVKNVQNSEKKEITEFCEALISKIEKADINLSFKYFLNQIYASLDEKLKNTVYETMIRTYSESLLNKVLTQEVSEEDVSKLAASKQIQRMYEKLMTEC